jgi:hypothetical protein
MMLLLLAAGTALAQSPGDHYPGSATRPSAGGTNAPYARTITVYGNVNTNDLLRFMDRTGSRVAGTNVLGALDYYGTNWQATAAAEAAARAAGDTVARTNLQAALTAEALARVAGDTVAMTNWQARVDALTNGAALGATALQPATTNGWTVGSHAGLATWPGATNAALAAWATAAETGTVSYAYAASRMSIAGDADYWMTVCDGTGALWRVSIASGGVSNSSYIIVTGWRGEEGYTGPATNTVFNLVQVDGLQRLYSAPGYVLEIDDTPTRQRKLYTSTNLQDPIYLSESDAYTFPEQLAATDESGAWVVVDWAYFVTNSYALATLGDLAPLPTFADLNASNNADRAYADADIRAAIDAIPLPPTNAVAGWLVWDSGSNCYWQVTATNLRFYVWGVAE